MQPEQVATYSWNLVRNGRTYALELKVFRVRFGLSEGSQVAYNYTLFADGEDVQLWQRPRLEGEQLAKAEAGNQFESWAVMMGL